MKQKDILKKTEQNGLSFETIVASGRNSSQPHAVPTEKQIESGDIITIDMGCKYKGYCSDMTRTIFVDEIQESTKKVYDLVLKNQKLALSQMEDGQTIKLISKIVEGNFKMNGFELVHALRSWCWT